MIAGSDLVSRRLVAASFPDRPDRPPAIRPEPSALGEVASAAARRAPCREAGCR